MSAQSLRLGTRVVRINPSVRPFVLPGLLFLLASFTALVVGVALKPEIALIATWLVLLTSILLPLLGLVRTTRRPPRALELSREGSCLRLTDSTDSRFCYELSRAEILSAAVKPLLPAHLDIETKRGDVLEIPVEDADDAWRLLGAASLDPRGHHAVFRGASATRATATVACASLGFMVALAALAPISTPLAFAASTVPGLLGMVFLHRSPANTVTVGTDAVVVERLGRKRKVIPHQDIVRAVAVGPALHLLLHEGPALKVPLPEEVAHAAVARIRHARMYGVVEANAALLELRGTSLEQARERLTKLSRGEGAYRGASISEQDLLAIATHPSSPTKTRVAAAWAIGLRFPELREQVRGGATQLAEPRVRILIDKALDDRIAEQDLDELVAEDELNPSTAH